MPPEPGLGDDFSRAAFGTGSPAEMSTQPSGMVNLAGAAWHGLKDLASRAMGAAVQYGEDGTYNPAPFVESALTSMGGPLVGAGVGAKAGEAVLGSGPIRTFHSSPHDFDKFDLSKLRTGQGANSYGPGTYLAENPAVSGQGGQYWQEFMRHPSFDRADREAADFLALHNFDRQKAAQQTRAQLERAAAGRPLSVEQAEFEQVVKLLESGKPVGPRTYEVNINAQPEQFLQWDKPVSQQGVWDRIHPEVRNSIDDTFDYRNMNAMSDALDDYTGRELYQALKHPDIHEALPPELPGSSWFTGSTDEAAHTMAYLRSLDVPGIRYADGHTRQLLRDIENANKTHALMVSGRQKDFGAWNEEAARLQAQPQTYNYVVNDPGILDIVKKYGIPGSLGAGLADRVMPQPTQTEQGM